MLQWDGKLTSAQLYRRARESLNADLCGKNPWLSLEVDWELSVQLRGIFLLIGSSDGSYSALTSCWAAMVT